ncbi:MAG TPA: class I SAM-dependent methyltransferase [Thiomicrorhabdus sp.]|nr:class I SAM-dependent methyltransferase [Thiomicrorhabdus sp.]
MSNSVTQTVVQKWEAKYQTATLQDTVNPCYVLKQHCHLLPFYGQALELASGLGGNARFMAQCGLKTDAWDISDTALTLLNNWANLNQLPIEPLITDLEQMILPYQKYDVIVVSRYLDRDLFAGIEQALKPNGLLFYQTFLSPPHKSAPQNPNFYVHSGEFNRVWPRLTTEVYGEGWLTPENSNLEAASVKQRYAWYVGRKMA